MSEQRFEQLLAEDPPRSMLKGDPLERAVWLLRSESFHRDADALVEYVVALEKVAHLKGGD